MNSEAAPTYNYLREFLHIFYAQRRLILSVAAAVFLAALAIVLIWPRTWAANGSFIVRGVADKSIMTLGSTKHLLERTRQEDLYSEAAIFESNDVIALTLQNLQADPESAISRLTASRIKGNITTRVLPTSNIVEVQFSWSDAEEAQRVLNMLMKNYLLFRNNLYNPPERQAAFRARGQTYMEHLENEQRQLLQAIEDSKAPDPALEIRHNLEIKQANKEKILLYAESVTDTEFLIKQIRHDLAAEDVHFFSYVDVDSITSLNSKLQELVIKRNNILTAYLPGSDKAVAVTKEVERTSQLLRTELAAYKRQLEDQVTALGKKIQMLKDSNYSIDERNYVLKELDVRLKNIEQELKLLGLSYDTFFKRREEADFDSASSDITSYVSVVAAARALEDPVFPRAGTLLPVGLGGGLLLGFALGFLREFLMHDFKRPEDVERSLGLPVIMSIPERDAAAAPSQAVVGAYYRGSGGGKSAPS